MAVPQHLQDIVDEIIQIADLLDHEGFNALSKDEKSLVMDAAQQRFTGRSFDMPVQQAGHGQHGRAGGDTAASAAAVHDEDATIAGRLKQSRKRTGSQVLVQKLTIEGLNPSNDLRVTVTQHILQREMNLSMWQ